MTRTRTRTSALALGACLPFVLLACSTDGDGPEPLETTDAAEQDDAAGEDAGPEDDAPADGEAAELETITLGLIPIIDVAPVYLGLEQGFFEEEGIELELSSGQGGAAIVPGVVSESIDIGFGNNFSLVIGASTGLPLRVIASGVESTGDPEEDPFTILTADDSLQRPADLEGRTVAVNTLNAIGDTVVRASVRADGGDPDAVEFVEMPFPNMNAALVSGDVDAAWQVEPFVTLGEPEGIRLLTTPLNDFTDEVIEVSTYFTSQAFAEENPELVERFTAAIEKSLTYSQDNPDAVREILPDYLEVTPELAEQLILPAWDTEVSEATFEIFTELAQTDGLISGDVDLDALLGR